MEGTRHPIALLAGDDRRERVAARTLHEWGATVWAVGFPPDTLPTGIRPASLAEALAEAPVVLLPVRPPDPGNRVDGAGIGPVRLDTELFPLCRPETHLIVTRANPWLRKEAPASGFRLTELMERDDFALYNAVPTAEGAVAVALAESDVTIAGSRAVIVGFGRSGQALARLLLGMGARVTVVARRPADRARAECWGCAAVPFEAIEEAVADAAFLFNTVPAPVIDERLLALLPADSLTIDTASAPGGVDRAAAARLGRAVRHELGLPGRYAPRTAGRVMARVVWELLANP